MENIKLCKYCHKEIHAEAIKCKHCRRILPSSGRISLRVPRKTLLILLTAVLIIWGSYWLKPNEIFKGKSFEWLENPRVLPRGSTMYNFPAVKSHNKHRHFAYQPAELVFVEGGEYEYPSNELQGIRRGKMASFYIGQRNVTNAEWEDFMELRYDLGHLSYTPVKNVSWYDCIEFCNRKSRKEKLTPCYYIDGAKVICDFNANGYRLPTVAELEYAIKGSGKSKDYYIKENKQPYFWGISGESKFYKKIYCQSRILNEVEWCWDWCSTYVLLDFTPEIKKLPWGVYKSIWVRTLRNGTNNQSDFLLDYFTPNAYYAGFRLCRSHL